MSIWITHTLEVENGFWKGIYGLIRKSLLGVSVWHEREKGADGTLYILKL